MIPRKALSLIEMILVLVVLTALTGIIIPLCNDQLSSAAQVTTRATLAEVQQAVQNYWHDTKLITLDGIQTFANESQRFEITWLFKNPVTNDTTIQYAPNLRSGWNGPYLTVSTVLTGGPGVVDAWNRPILVQYVNPADALKDIRLISRGPDGILDIPGNAATNSLTAESVGDDLYVALTLR